jgi:glycosyltransferase involved in cell wall biosynthesis
MSVDLRGSGAVELPPALAAVADEAVAHGIRRVGAVAWRDLDHPDAGGAEVHLDAVLSRWAAAGLDVTLHTATVPGRPARAVRNGYRVERRGGAVTGLATSPWAARRGRPDAVVEAWHGINFCGPVWASGPRLAIAHHVHAAEFRLVLPRPAAWAACRHEATVSPRLYRRTPLVALSPSVRDDLVGLGYARSTITVVPPGVGAHFAPGGTRARHPLLLTVGRLAPVKAVGTVVTAAAALADRYPGLELVVVGDGPCRVEVEAQARRMGAPARFTGRVSDAALVDLYRSAWLLVSASAGEGWGMTVTEAAACATPAVVVDNSGHRHAVADGVTGVLCRTGADLAEGITGLLDDPGRREAMGLAAQRRADALTWDRTAADMLGVLVADARRRRAQRAPT